jgi:hypothetical protein
VRPVGGEDVVRLATEQQCVEARHAGADLLADDVVDERCLPTAVLEAALGVLVRCPGCPRDEVGRCEQVDVNKSHVTHYLGPGAGGLTHPPK